MPKILGLNVKLKATKIHMLILNFFHALRKGLKKSNFNNNENNVSVFIRSSSQYSRPLRTFTTKYNETSTKGTFVRINTNSA